ncbi:hypothetical protein DM02DRAFT_597433 [Periconia macrospinosa]|uniref:2'-phosphotransferase n=1 Tax=Periconia macrospinosa TaxID=97972 RepID=A0A2V1DHA0_9PLEO|nr:hypothetical protein DM02DRAFT_597433 [Periconia macrospinosa]
MARGGRRDEMTRESQVSRKVSWLLRHGAESEGLKLGKGGYVGVADALNTKALKSLKVTFPELKQVVADNDKQRFSMIPVSKTAASASSAQQGEAIAEAEAEISQENLASIPESADPADYLIRANQGHSIKVGTEGLLTPLTLTPSSSSPPIPEIVVHGTDARSWNLILKSGGMRKMGRTHMHFASGLPAGFKTVDSSSADTQDAPLVISGMRNSSSILIYIDIQKALKAGIEWFVSENGVILTAGNEDGLLGCEFFERVELRKKEGGQVLMRDGVVPEGTVVDVEGWEKEVAGSGKGKGKRGGRGGGRGRGDRGGKARVNDDSADLMAGV